MALSEREQAILDNLQQQFNDSPTLDKKKLQKIILGSIVSSLGFVLLIVGLIVKIHVISIVGFLVALYAFALLFPRNLRNIETNSYNPFINKKHSQKGNSFFLGLVEKFKNKRKTLDGRITLTVFSVMLALLVITLGAGFNNSLLSNLGLILFLIVPLLLIAPNDNDKKDEENF